MSTTPAPTLLDNERRRWNSVQQRILVLLRRLYKGDELYKLEDSQRAQVLSIEELDENCISPLINRGYVDDAQVLELRKSITLVMTLCDIIEKALDSYVPPRPPPPIPPRRPQRTTTSSAPREPVKSERSCTVM